MKHKLNTSDPDFLEVYEKATSLLQTFIDRQCHLRELNKKNGNTSEVFYEQAFNAYVIRLIQWVRYHFWGNDDRTIMNKTNITDWTFRTTRWCPSSSYCIKHSQFAQDTLNIDPSTEYISASNLVEAILDIITPKREHSIFAINDHIEESINLKIELDRIKSKIHPNDPIC